MQTEKKTFLGGIGIGFLWFLLKCKTLLLTFFGFFKFAKLGILFKGLFVFLKLGKFVGTFISMFLMIWFYAMQLGWSFAIGFVLLIFIHEMGHYVAAKYECVEVSAPVFIPMVGAIIKGGEAKNAKSESIIGIAGPLAGTLGAFVCLIIGSVYNSVLFSALAYIGFIMTLFNLIPIHPMDGGRTVTAISPYLWLIGIPIFIWTMFKFFNPLSPLILIAGLYQTYHLWKDRNNPYYETEIGFKIIMGIIYFGLLLVSVHYSFNLEHYLSGMKFK